MDLGFKHRVSNYTHQLVMLQVIESMRYCRRRDTIEEYSLRAAIGRRRPLRPSVHPSIQTYNIRAERRAAQSREIRRLYRTEVVSHLTSRPCRVAMPSHVTN